MATIRELNEEDCGATVDVLGETSDNKREASEKLQEYKEVLDALDEQGLDSGVSVKRTCTTSNEPVFDGCVLNKVTHINAVGAFKPEARELDDETVRKSRVVVETREAAMEEAGDLLIPLHKGAINRGHIVSELNDLVKGKPVRGNSEDITLFESVGIAYEDLIIASTAFRHLN